MRNYWRNSKGECQCGHSAEMHTDSDGCTGTGCECSEFSEQNEDDSYKELRIADGRIR